MKKYLIYAGMFFGSFLVINVGMYFILGMTQPEGGDSSHTAADSTEIQGDSLQIASPKMVEATTADSVAGHEPAPPAVQEHADVSTEITPDIQPTVSDIEQPIEALASEAPVETGEHTQEFVDVADPGIQTALQVGDPKELTKLAKVLEGMKADDAAAIASRLEIEEIVSLLMKMKDRKAAKMMAALPVEQAARVAARMSEIVGQGSVQS